MRHNNIFKYRWLVLCLICVNFTWSCAPARPKLGAPVDDSFAHSLLTNWTDRAGQVRSIQGLAKVKVNAPMTEVKGNQVLLVEKKDKLRAETLSPFGVPLLTLTANSGQLGVHLPSQNLYYIGAATPDNLGLFVHIPLNVSDLVNLLLYQPNLIDAWKQEAYVTQGGGWTIVRYGALQRQELVFDTGRNLVETLFYEQNELIAKMKYSNFKHLASNFPMFLSLEIPRKHATLTLEFSDMEINAKPRP